MKIVICAIMVGALALATGCGGGAGSSSNNFSSQPTVASVQVTPGSISIGVAGTQQFIATAKLSDGTTKDVTNSAQWSSSDSNVADINTAGFATGMAAGTVSITAVYSTGQGAATLKVSGAAANLVSITVAPTSASIPTNSSQQFTAIGNYNDGSSADITGLVSWSSSSSAVAIIDTTGLATGIAAGTTNISASFAGVSQSTTLTITAPSIVSITVTPDGLTEGIGITQQFVATATYSDGSSADLTTGITWNSSAASVATINASGLATTTGAGATSITATIGSFTDTATLTVVAAHLVSISVSPATPNIALGTTQQFSAVGTFDDGSTQLLPLVTWSSSATSVATVDSTGFAASTGTGSTTITATSGSVSGTASLTVSGATLLSIAVTPANSSMAVSTTKQYTATGAFSDSSTQDITSSVTWSSSTPAVATINAQGLASSVATGNTTIKAALGTISGSTPLTVSNVQLVSITISPANPRISKRTSIRFTATGTFSDGSVSSNLSGITWKSSKPSIASIRSTGIANGKKTGSVTISASSSGITGTTTLTIGSGTLVSVAITPVSATATVGGTLQFTATGTFSDGSTQDVTLNGHWSSSSSSVATIANAPSIAGLANCFLAGTTSIGVNSGGITASNVLTVQ